MDSLGTIIKNKMGEQIPYKLRKDFTGQKFGMLTVIDLAYIRNNRSYWNLKCDCGNSIVKLIKKVNSLKYTSCGCLVKEGQSQTMKKHGMTGHPVHAVWSSMLDRCRLPTHQAWHNYGARGIKVCECWQESFENFWSDMGNDYEYGLTLDRKDVNGNYCKENCRWITMKEQSRNRRNNTIIDTPWGRMCVSEAAEKSGVGSSTILYRLQKKWPKEFLFIKPDCSRRLKSLLI